MKTGIFIFRFSGAPLAVADLKARNDEFRSRYDALEVEMGRDMLSLEQATAKMEAELNTKWEVTKKIAMPKSKKSWLALVNLYEAPVIVAKSSHNPNEMVLVVMDEMV